MSKAYFNCHTDITIPYKELELIEVIVKNGENIEIIRDGRFVLPGTEELNRPFEKQAAYLSIVMSKTTLTQNR